MGFTFPAEDSSVVRNVKEIVDADRTRSGLPRRQPGQTLRRLAGLAHERDPGTGLTVRWVFADHPRPDRGDAPAGSVTGHRTPPH